MTSAYHKPRYPPIALTTFRAYGSARLRPLGEMPGSRRSGCRRPGPGHESRCKLRKENDLVFLTTNCYVAALDGGFRLRWVRRRKVSGIWPSSVEAAGGMLVVSRRHFDVTQAFQASPTMPDEQSEPNHGVDVPWDEAQTLTDLQKLEKALKERSGGSMIAPLMDVFHIAQRRYRYTARYENAFETFANSGKYAVAVNADKIREIRPVNSSP